MKSLRIVLGTMLIASSVGIFAFWGGTIDSAPPILRLMATGLAIAIFIGGVSATYLGIAGDVPKRAIQSARRVGLISLTVATVIAGAVALAIVLHLGVNPGLEAPWMARFYSGVFFAALFLAALGLWKAFDLGEWAPIEPDADDPYDPPEPLEDMIEPDPGPTLVALLARKRSLNLVRAR